MKKAMTLGLMISTACLISGCSADTKNSGLQISLKTPAASQPNNASLDQAKFFLQQREYGLAIKVLNRLLRTDPDNANTYNALAIAYDGLGRPENARRNFELALANAPQDGRIYRNFSRHLTANGHIALAQKLRRDFEVAMNARALEKAKSLQDLSETQNYLALDVPIAIDLVKVDPILSIPQLPKREQPREQRVAAILPVSGDENQKAVIQRHIEDTPIPSKPIVVGSTDQIGDLIAKIIPELPIAPVHNVANALPIPTPMDKKIPTKAMKLIVATSARTEEKLASSISPRSVFATRSNLQKNIRTNTRLQRQSLGEVMLLTSAVSSIQADLAEVNDDKVVVDGWIFFKAATESILNVASSAIQSEPTEVASAETQALAFLDQISSDFEQREQKRQNYATDMQRIGDMLYQLADTSTLNEMRTALLFKHDAVSRTRLSKIELAYSEGSICFA